MAISAPAAGEWCKAEALNGLLRRDMAMAAEAAQGLRALVLLGDQVQVPRSHGGSQLSVRLVPGVLMFSLTSLGTACMWHTYIHVLIVFCLL